MGFIADAGKKLTNGLPAIPPQPQQQPYDPMAVINGILGGQSPDFNALARSQVSSVYAPQYGALNSAGSRAQAQAGKNDALLNAMYGQLSKDIGGQVGNINKAYGNEVSGINSAYNQGVAGVGNAYTGANSQLTDLYNRLGIQAAGADPRTLQANLGQEAVMKSLLNVNNQTAQDAARTQQKGSLDFNTAQQGVARSSGAEQRALLQRGLADRLFALDQQRAQLEGQQANQALQLAQGIQFSYLGQQNNMANMVMQAYKDQMDTQQKMYQFEMTRQPSAYQQWEMLGPGQKAFTQASQLFGAGGNQASTAVNLIQSIGAGDHQFNNAFQFADAVAQKNAGLPPEQRLPSDALKSLAVTMFSQYNTQQLPSYMPASQYGGYTPWQ